MPQSERCPTTRLSRFRVLHDRPGQPGYGFCATIAAGWPGGSSHGRWADGLTSNGPGGKVQSFKRGTDFPHEGFVQKAIEAHFSTIGFDLESGSHADLVARNKNTGERWLVEAKGVTTSIGLDFRTGLGQLIQRMADPKTTYALAVPREDRFISQCRAVPLWIRQALRLHWLLVNSEGGVQVIPPDESP